MGNQISVTTVPEVSDLNIPYAKYANFDPMKRTDEFSKIKLSFENHAKTTPEAVFKYELPESAEGRIALDYDLYKKYAEKLCKEAQKKGWKCNVRQFGASLEMNLDK